MKIWIKNEWTHNASFCYDTIILVLSYTFAIESFNSCFTPICVMAVIMKLK